MDSAGCGAGPRRRTPPIAWRLLLGLALAKVALHLVSAAFLAYGYMSDEFYYLDCAAHMAWGYVDHPPFSVAALWLMRNLFGDSLVAVRLLPALAGGATIVLVGAMARELGGGRAAQGLAGLATLIAPVYLATSGFYSMNALEPALWALAALLLLRIFNGGDRRLWLLVGVTLGCGLLNKISTLWFGSGLFVGLLLTPQRRWLGTRWPWLAAAAALALFVPHLVWQIRHGWPTLEFMRNAAAYKLPAKSPSTFIGEQVLMMHPLAVPFWLAGLGFYFLSRDARPYRVLGYIWLTVFIILLGSGQARSNYIGPAYSVLLAPGGVVIERWARARSWHWLPPAVAGVLATGGAVIAPLAIDLLPPEKLAAYQHTVGLEAPTDQLSELGPMPLHFALRFGWPEMTQTVARVYRALPADERRRAGILVETFGEAGAIDFFGPSEGLPAAISPHNNYWLWGTHGYSGEILLVVTAPGSPVLDLFESVERAAAIDCRYCLPEEAAKSVYVCRRARRPLSELWPQLKSYV